VKNLVKRRTLTFIVLAFSVWGILATGMAGYYYLRFNDTLEAFQEIESLIINVDLLIDYGNGTETWHNGTELMAGSTAFDALIAVATDVQYETYSTGKLITRINGKGGGDNSGWFWFFWDTEKLEWNYSLDAIDQYILYTNDTIKFELTSW
jgi:hypothetical protein